MEGKQHTINFQEVYYEPKEGHSDNLTWEELLMRKLIYFSMVSLDGKIETPDRSLDWVVIDEELHRFINQLERGMGGYLYGRRMYELMQAYWPTADTQSSLDYEVEFSKIWKQITKYVFSQSLEQVDGNAELVKTDATAEVVRLKSTQGPDLEVGGSHLAGVLMQAGLIDEFRLFFHPVILGAGTPMVAPVSQAIKLRLVEERSFRSGVVYLRYQAERK
jgi:dihydrofolate reductase